MKHIHFALSFFLLGSTFSGCNKWAEDKQNIYEYVAPPPPGGAIPANTPLCGSIKGVMTTGNTYTLGCTINVPAGDTLILEPGVTVNANPNSGIIVHGSLISLGTQAQPNVFTVPGVTKNNTPALPITEDSAHIGLWKGLMCDTSCKMLILKWTHIDFAGAAYGNVDGPAVEESAGTSFNILFQNPNGYLIMEDCWVYGGTDDCIRCSNGKIHVFRNTFEKCGGSGGDCVNSKGGTVGTVAYNLFIGTAYNGQKASNKGQPVGAPETNIVMYNSTFVNGGTQIVRPVTRAGGIDYEQGAPKALSSTTSLSIARVGYRVVNNPVADTAHLTYGNNYQWADSLDGRRPVLHLGAESAQNPCPPISPPHPSTCPRISTTQIPRQNAYDGTPVVQYDNPLNSCQLSVYPCKASRFLAYTAVGNFNFRLDTRTRR
jgi:hypothetical protein